MIDNFSLGLTHALMLWAAWSLLRRTDLNDDSAKPITPKPIKRWGERRDA